METGHLPFERPLPPAIPAGARGYRKSVSGSAGRTIGAFLPGKSPEPPRQLRHPIDQGGQESSSTDHRPFAGSENSSAEKYT